MFELLTWWERGGFNQTQIWVPICRPASWGWTATIINFRGLSTEGGWMCLLFLEGIFHCHNRACLAGSFKKKERGKKNNTARSVGHRLYHSTISFFCTYSGLIDAHISALLLQSLLTLMRLQLLCAVLFQSHILFTLQICLWSLLMAFAQY